MGLDHPQAGGEPIQHHQAGQGWRIPAEWAASEVDFSPDLAAWTSNQGFNDG